MTNFNTVNHEVYQALGHLEVDRGIILTDEAVANIWRALKASGLEIARTKAAQKPEKAGAD